MPEPYDGQQLTPLHGILQRKAKKHCLRLSKGTWVAIIAIVLTHTTMLIGWVQSNFDEAKQSIIEIDKRMVRQDEQLTTISTRMKKFDDGRERAARNEQRLKDMGEQMNRILRNIDKLPTK